jgi:uncharacterized protein DUF4351
MPIHLDIMDNEFIGPLICQKQKEAAKEAITRVLLLQIEKRFGRVPTRIKRRLGSLNPEQFEAASLNIFDAQRIEDIFG